jgi:radical SAM-linked protein
VREQPEQQAPPVQRLRIRYAKRGRLRFTSHRDFSRAFERAVFRARVPMAYSSGFNPHPRISYAGAAPMGSASEAEYVEIALAAVVDPADVRAKLDLALPEGLDLLEVVVSAGGTLADQLQASHWRITLAGLEPAVVAAAVEQFLATEEVPVERMTKKGLRTFDSRSAVVRMNVDPPLSDAEVTRSRLPCAILQVVLRHGTPSVRPDDILAGLREIAGLSPVAAAVQQRLAQGPLDPRDGTVGDPLAPDRDAAEGS